MARKASTDAVTVEVTGNVEKLEVKHEIFTAFLIVAVTALDSDATPGDYWIIDIDDEKVAV